MVRKSVKTKDGESDVEDSEFKNSIESLLGVLIEQMEEQYFNELEAFESYSKRVHLKLYKDLDGFCDRFLKGYEVIIKEIKDPKDDGKP